LNVYNKLYSSPLAVELLFLSINTTILFMFPSLSLSLSLSLSGVDCVYHIAALVGPYYPKDAYHKVNYEGTLNVLTACRTNGIKRIVMSSSPSTRFPYPDPNIKGLSEDQLKELNNGEYTPVFLAPYAETKG
jgi:nucleoside-diphosphate-sugar epimerase